MDKATRSKRNRIKMRIGYWFGKSSHNPELLNEAETEILKLKSELVKLTGKDRLF